MAFWGFRFKPRMYGWRWAGKRWSEAAEGILRGISPRSHKRISKLRQPALLLRRSHLLPRGAIAEPSNCNRPPGLPPSIVAVWTSALLALKVCRATHKPYLGLSMKYQWFFFFQNFLSFLRIASLPCNSPSCLFSYRGKEKWILLTQMELLSFSGAEDRKLASSEGIWYSVRAQQSTPARSV